jgi:hypothetical protein
MIMEMNSELTFQQSEIQSGDIICFQKVLTEKEYILALYNIFICTFYI